VHFCLQPYDSFTLLLYLAYHFIPALAACTQPCYFSLLLKPAAQKMKMDWNSLMRSSRLALPRLLSCGLWSLPLFSFRESHLSLWRHYSCNYTLFETFGYLWTLLVRVCGINDPRHTCDDYLVLIAKPGMTRENDLMLKLLLLLVLNSEPKL
jgi:hypothetical protein